jgi:hypothetical protein
MDDIELSFIASFIPPFTKRGHFHATQDRKGAYLERLFAHSYSTVYWTQTSAIGLGRQAVASQRMQTLFTLIASSRSQIKVLLRVFCLVVILLTSTLEHALAKSIRQAL